MCNIEIIWKELVKGNECWGFVFKIYYFFYILKRVKYGMVLCRESLSGGMLEMCGVFEGLLECSYIII